MKRNLIKSFVFLILFLCIFVALFGTAFAQATDPFLVTVKQGILKGLVTDHREFRGIPFAAPPVGDLRFRPPENAPVWSGVRDATQFGGSSAQLPFIVSEPNTNEDCLYLNVYTPLKGKDLPVMVWIHGGAFINGSGSAFVGATMAKKRNVIVVTINYRLGALGFLSLPGLAAENEQSASGNYGIMDQQQALRWVKANIARFGGNPGNVTIFGESAGGSSVLAHLVSPASAGLFQKAIIQSGPDMADSKEAGYQKGKKIVTHAGCVREDAAAEVACMRALSVDKILAAQTEGISLTIDGVTFKTPMREAVTSGKFNRVPVMEGANLNEGRLMAYFAFDFTGHPLTPELYANTIQGQFGPAASRVLAEYPLSKYPSPIEAYSAVLGDSLFSCSSRAHIRLFTTQGIPVYAYEFRDPNPPLPGLPAPVLLGPSHATEIVYVFQDRVSGIIEATMLTKDQLKLSDQMLSYWTNFARSGNPNGKGLPVWRKYENVTDSFLGLTSVSHDLKDVRTFSADHHCGFWDTLGK